jgi:transcriptional regulator with GAF, ATPase, and Fis domain
MTDAMPMEHGLTLDQALAEISTVFIGLSPDRIDAEIERAVGRVGELAGADRVTVTQLGAPGEAPRRTHQWVRETVPRMPGDDSVTPFPWVASRVVQGRETVVIASVDELPIDAVRDRAALARFSICSLAAFPLTVADDVVGALSFATVELERPCPAALVHRLRTASEMVANALARQRAHQDLVRQLEFEQLVAQLAAAFVNLPAAALDDHITAVLGRVAEFLDLDRSNLAQRGVADEAFHVTHQWVREGWPPMPPFVPEKVMPWIVEQALAGNEVAFSDLDDLPPAAAGERAFFGAHGPRAALLTPLTANGTVIGAVAFGSFRRRQVWSPDLIRRLGLVANLIGNALARQRADVELRATLDENERLRRRLEAENEYLQQKIKSAHALDDEIVGRSRAIRAVLHKVDQVAGTDVPVLLLGETGVGKELFAHAIHARSTRPERPLITVNCAALPPSLIESELFGHEKGAFTGATQARAGRFELADGGTLFLDEIGDLDAALQAKLLRALQGGEIQRLGSSRTHKVDVRIIAATNRDLQREMEEGRFRQDLYYRLGVFPVEVPPLRERREDIPLLVWHFIQGRQSALRRIIKDVPAAAMDALVAYDWPGNVRELQNVIDRALILSTGAVLTIDEAFGPTRPTRESRRTASLDTLRDTERTHIMRMLDRCGWKIEGRGQAADRLGLRPSTLRNRMRKLGISRPASAE